MHEKLTKGKKSQKPKPVPPPHPLKGTMVTDFDALLGQGNDLWKTDEEFEEFLEELRQRCRNDLAATKKP